MKWGTVVASFVAVIMAAALYYAFWPSEERVIRARLVDIATILTVPANESSIARVARVSHLRDYLTPDFSVRYGNLEPASRDAVLAAVAQFGQSPDGVKVEFVDVQVTIDPQVATRAHAYFTAKVSGRDTVDAREADVTLAKTDGAWLVTNAETKETLTR